MKELYFYNNNPAKMSWKVILVGLLFLITSCMNAQPSPNANSLRELLQSNSNCNVPCWQDISPNNSTDEDVEQMLLGLTEEELKSYQRTEMNPDFVQYSWYNEKQGLVVGISLFRGVVDFIWLVPTTSKLVPFDLSFLTPLPQRVDGNQPPPNESVYTYKLADIFEVVGEPSEYSALLSRDFHGTKFLTLSLFYQSGLIVDNVYFEDEISNFDFDDGNSCNIAISSDWSVQRLYFTNATTLSNKLSGTGSRLTFFNEDIYTWNAIDNIRLSNCNLD